MPPKETAANRVVAELYVDGCRQLFAAYGLTARLERQHDQPVEDSASRYLSIICATGPTLRLLSTIYLSADMLAAIHPAAERGLSRRDLEDWCMELNNQLLGRVKNKLLRRGCELVIGLPSVLRGSGMKAATSPDLVVRHNYFSSDHGTLIATLAMLVSPHLDLNAELAGAEAQSVGHEGAVSLF